MCEDLQDDMSRQKTLVLLLVLAYGAMPTPVWDKLLLT